MTALNASDFVEFMTAVTGFSPFPWQDRLARQVLEPQGQWPELLDLPTGVGKTSVLAIALFCMAVKPSSTPRRIVLVVDRRIIVDQVHAFATRLANAIEHGDAPSATSTDGACGKVARALQRLTARREGRSVLVSVLRGGVPHNNEWLSSPDQPSIVVSTVDQVGSRLLFRGYGVSAGMRPVHAGVLARDTLFFLDEVHLATAFEQTLAQLRGYMSERWCEQQVGRDLLVVRMSATPPRRTGDTDAANDDTATHPFRLDAADRAHAVLQRRLLAAKPATLEVVKTKREFDEASRAANAKSIAHAAVVRAKRVIAGGARVVGVVVNRVATARAASAMLEREAGITTHLLTGRMRPIDRESVQASVEAVAASGVTTKPGNPHSGATVVVATSCIEAGADLDFDALITVAASLPSLRQRFGRLNRLGAREDTQAWVLVGKHQLGVNAKDDPIYGSALRETWAYLETVATENIVDFGVEAFPQPSDAELYDKLTGAFAHPPLLFPKYLDMLSETCPAPRPDPDISLWLHGVERDRDSDVNLVFRAELDTAWEQEQQGQPLDPHGIEQLKRDVVEQLEFMRPLADEAVAVRIGEFRTWAKRKLSSCGEVKVWRWQTNGPEAVRLSEVRPQDTVVLPCCKGGLRKGSWDPDADVPVDDIADLAHARRLAPRGDAMKPVRIRLQKSTLPLGRLGYPNPPSGEAAEDPQAWRTAERELLDWFACNTPMSAAMTQGVVLNETPTHAERRALWWEALFADAADASKNNATRFEVTPIGNAGWRVMLRRTPRPVAASSEDGSSSFTGQAYGLQAHLDEVRVWAAALARTTGLGKALAEDVATAGLLHDVGKVDSRFQLWLYGADPVAASCGKILAKSKFHSSRRERDEARHRSGWPSGLRHEMLSLVMFEGCDDLRARTHDPELVAHLIASHHGWCRPWAPSAVDPDPRQVVLDVGDIRLSARTSEITPAFLAQCPARFRTLCRRYGWYGLAYLEAIVRLSDHQASAAPGSRPAEIS